MNREEKISLYGYIEDLYQAMQIGSITFEPKHSSELYELISKVLKENQELKRQLSNSHQIKNQQKEFIEWLENELVSELDVFTEIKVCDVLSKYKEIIGVEDEEINVL